MLEVLFPARLSEEAGSERHNKKSLVVLLRWVLVIAASYLVLFTEHNQASLLTSHCIVLFLITSNLVISTLPKQWFESSRFDSFLVLFDVCMISLAVWLTGQFHSDFYLLYFLIIMIAAVSDTVRSLLLSACVVSAVYLSLKLGAGGIAEVTKSDVLIRIPFFFIVAIFYGHLVQRVRAERTAKVDYQRKLGIATRLRRFGDSLSNSLNRNEILKTLVRAQRNFCQSRYCGVLSVSMGKMLIQSGDSKLQPSVKKVNVLLQRIEQKVGATVSDSTLVVPSILAELDTESALTAERHQAGFFSEGYTLLPVGGQFDSDLYICLWGQLDEDTLEYSRVLMCNASMSLKNASQFQALINEVNNRRALTQQLSRALEFRTEFLAGMSHEIRSPVYSFIGCSQLLLDGSCGTINAEQGSILAKMKSNADQLLELVNDILDISKLEAGAVRARPSVGSLPEFAHEIIEMCSPLLNDKPVGLKASIAVDMPLLSLDWQLLRQVAMNLVSNAVKFTNRGGILLAADFLHQQSTLVVRVKDTGVGIEGEKIVEIFEAFSQAEHNYNKKYVGTGLGLAITKKLIELMHGTIEVRSEVGKGSEFIITIPVTAASKPRSAVSGKPNLVSVEQT